MLSNILQGFKDEMEKISGWNINAATEFAKKSRDILKQKALSGPSGATLARHTPKPAKEAGDVLRYQGRGKVDLIKQPQAQV